MKRNIIIALALVLLLALSGCQSGGGGEYDGTLASIIEKMYEIKDSDAVQAYTGLSEASDISEIAVSEAMIGSQAYSLVLVRASEGAAAKDIAQAMKEGIDPWKWICVGADDLQVVARGDIVMLAMVSSELSDAVTSQDLVDAFIQVLGGEPDVAL
jgi:hypothetical protein